MDTSNNYLLYLSHENINKRNVLQDTLKKIENVEVRIFEWPNIIFEENNDWAVLIISDIYFERDKIQKIQNGLLKINENIVCPYLFIIDDNDDKFDLEFSNFLNSYNITYDFIRKPFIDPIFINRIKSLLNIPIYTKEVENQKFQIQGNIWNILNYSNFFVIVLDKLLKIKLSNYKLAQTLGFKMESEMLELSWDNFVRPGTEDIIAHVHERILGRDQNYNEFTNDIIDKDGKIITVKWFNSLINDGVDWSFSIGIPLTKSPLLDEGIDSIRAYFTDIIQRDKTAINAMKEVTIEYSKKILKESKKETQIDCK